MVNKICRKVLLQSLPPQNTVSYLIFEHRVVIADKVDIDIPGPVADDDHQAEDEEEDDEVGGLGVGTVQQTQHGHQHDHTQCDVQIPAHIR